MTIHSERGRNVHKRKLQKNRTYQNPGWAENIMQSMSNVEKSSQGLVHMISVDEMSSGNDNIIYKFRENE